MKKVEGSSKRVVSSKFNIVGSREYLDLAGSERAAASENKGQRQVEGASINKSLLALGNVINTLSNPNKRGKRPS